MHERTLSPTDELLKAQYGTCIQVIYQIQEYIGTTRMYNLSADYADILIAILNHSDLDHESFQKLKRFVLEDSVQSPNKKYREEVLSELLPQTPFQGLTIIEIGGPFGQILHALGAEVWCIDPDINGKSDRQRVNWNYSPKARAEQYHPVAVRLTANNWQEYVSSGQFNITYSHDVLSTNSGTSSDWRKRWHRKYEAVKSQGILEKMELYRQRDEEYRQLAAERKGPEAQARKDLFIISANVTKTDGLVLHQGDAIETLLPLAQNVSLAFKGKRNLGATLHNYPDCALYEFVKQ